MVGGLTRYLILFCLVMHFAPVKKICVHRTKGKPMQRFAQKTVQTLWKSSQSWEEKSYTWLYRVLRWALYICIYIYIYQLFQLYCPCYNPLLGWMAIDPFLVSLSSYEHSSPTSATAPQRPLSTRCAPSVTTPAPVWWHMILIWIFM